MSYFYAAGPQLLAAVDMHFHVIWPRFITSMVILGGIIGALIYMQLRK